MANFNYGICPLSVVPCRKDPSDKSEMVTQLLFGDAFEITGQYKEWRNIRTQWDGYDCWIDRKQILPVSRETFEKISASPPAVVTDLVQVITDVSSGQTLPVVFGSSLPLFDGKECLIEENGFTFTGNSRLFSAPPSRNDIVETAMLFLNAPYLWGGRSPFGIDCSGFTQVVFKANGVRLLRDAWQQADGGQSCSFVEEAEPGDLAFFDNEDGRIIHVGIVIGDNKLIHASGRVRIDPFDHYGIFSQERGGYTHNLRVIRKVTE